ncbi:zinc ribbon domain-containing protein [Salibacterium sp. K-3]
MKYCPSCGTEAKQEAAFCPSCGTPFSTKTLEKKSLKEKWKELSKVYQLSIISAAGVLIIVVVFIQLGHMLSSPERTVSAFEEALEEQNAERLTEMVIAEDEQMEVKTEDIESILAYLEERPSASKEIISSLESEASDFQKEDQAAAAVMEADGSLFSLMKEEGTWFDNYKVQMPSYYIEISTNMEGAELLVDGESAGIIKGETENIEYGPVPPGNFEVSAVYEGKYANLEKVEKLSTMNREERTLSQDVVLEGGETIITSEDIWKETESVSPVLKVNGDPVETDESLEKEIFPVSLDGSNTASMEAEFPWGKMESDPVPMEERRTEVTLEPIDATTKKELAGQAYDVIPAFEKAAAEESMENMEHLSDAAISDMKEDFNDSITVKSIDIDSFSYDQTYRYIENDKGEAALAGNFEMKYERTYERHDNEYDSSETDYYTMYYVYDEESDTWEIDEFTKENSFFNTMDNPVEYEEEEEV